MSPPISFRFRSSKNIPPSKFNSSNFFPRAKNASTSDTSPVSIQHTNDTNKPKRLPNTAHNLSAFERIKQSTRHTTAHGHPLILPTPYAVHGPVFDIIALYHNAVKRHALVVFNMADALIRYRFEVSHAETRLFFDWLFIFDDFLRSLFTIEDLHVFSFLEENSVHLPPELHRDTRQKRKQHVLQSIQHTFDRQDKLCLLPPGEALPILAKSVGAFLNPLLEYFKTENALLQPPIAAANIPDKKAEKLRTRFIRAFQALPNAPTYIAFLSHWLTSKHLSPWKARFLTLVDAIRYDRWTKVLASSHLSIPSRIVETISQKAS
ncbi:hypothetical protein BWQ96_04475 [Gracilariopsis chorda]|uniref:Uncharacterized protein n=1 Tax=Gracilariopsis chorda TaxID=448386 RepID=A0A2V3IVH1_9FLOR|nr:hypothetical protein BWQ96_04475 [Gracilariopsis chorda]|eukprot:PXF45707.1 hypothetical protein BWQ96_04475 [Gracilariopsis chorda]